MSGVKTLDDVRGVAQRTVGRREGRRATLGGASRLASREAGQGDELGGVRHRLQPRPSGPPHTRPPSHAQIAARHGMPPHAVFANICSRIMHHEPPCMSDADDWESSAMFLGEEHVPTIQPIAERNQHKTIMHLTSESQGAMPRSRTLASSPSPFAPRRAVRALAATASPLPLLCALPRASLRRRGARHLAHRGAAEPAPRLGVQPPQHQGGLGRVDAQL